MIADSSIFDWTYYLLTNEDVRNAINPNNAQVEAIRHWLVYGINEGRRGSSEFDSRYYLARWEDVRAAFGATNYRGAMDHYLVYGKNDGRIGANDELRYLSINDVTLNEGNNGNQIATFTVTLNHVHGHTITVDYNTANDSAGANSDYQRVSGTLVFNPGETTKTISVSVYGDVYNEDNERFFLDLSSPSNAVIGRGRGVGNINNDDSAFINVNGFDLSNVVHNVTGNQRGEIILRNSNGDVGSFITNHSGDGTSNWYYRVGTADSNITMLGAGDINGDGREEILFRVSYGDIFAFRLNEQGIATEFYRVGGADVRIPVVGIGDITGDGRDEIIFRVTQSNLGQDVGNVAAFFMDSNGVAYKYERVGWADPVNAVVGTGDITGDGRSEIIFRQPNGDVRAFKMNSDGLAVIYDRVGEADARIPIVGIGDITGDNRDEIIFQIKQDGLGQTIGNVTAFKMNSDGLAISYYLVGNANAEMPIVGVGDITGDNRDEILFQQSNGYISAFQMDEGGIAYRYYQVNAVNPKVVGANYSTPSISISDVALYEGNSGLSTGQKWYGGEP